MAAEMRGLAPESATRLSPCPHRRSLASCSPCEPRAPPALDQSPCTAHLVALPTRPRPPSSSSSSCRVLLPAPTLHRLSPLARSVSTSSNMPSRRSSATQHRRPRTSCADSQGAALRPPSDTSSALPLPLSLCWTCTDHLADTELRPPRRFPNNKLAAVLVLLHLNPLGELSVTLTTRSSRLRSHPGETALPGGRWEEGDGEGGVWTAVRLPLAPEPVPSRRCRADGPHPSWTQYREAYEEIGLPLPPRDSVFPSTSPRRPEHARPPPSHLLHLTTLAPFTSRTLLVVLPVVALLLEPAATATSVYLPRVLVPSPDEVAAVFHLPLRAFLLRPRPPSSSSTSSPTRPSTRSTPRRRPAPGTEALSHSFADFTWLLERPYRLHSFSSADEGVTPSAVTGLTADIVVRCAMIAESGRLGAHGEEGGEEEEVEERLKEPGRRRASSGGRRRSGSRSGSREG